MKHDILTTLKTVAWALLLGLGLTAAGCNYASSRPIELKGEAVEDGVTDGKVVEETIVDGTAENAENTDAADAKDPSVAAADPNQDDEAAEAPQDSAVIAEAPDQIATSVVFGGPGGGAAAIEKEAAPVLKPVTLADGNDAVLGDLRAGIPTKELTLPQDPEIRVIQQPTAQDLAKILDKDDAPKTKPLCPSGQVFANGFCFAINKTP